MSKDYTPGESYAYHDGYGQGVIDAKEHLIKKFINTACEYLDDTLYEVVSGVSNEPDVMSIQNTTMEEFISNFRKNMMDKL
jgi:hypothetical protein